jgi:enterochelin esterase-like enzyme
MIDKFCYVYLPYGYEQNASQRYDILYFMHGGGSTAEKFLGGNDSISLNRKTLDHMIEEKLIKPMIVVTPSFYRNDIREDSLPNAGDLVKMFPRELTEELMPAIESNFRTYAKDTTPDGLKAARSHRAFSGFSMGSVTTWWVFNKALDYFQYFFPLSGDSWVVQQLGGSQAPEATAEALAAPLADNKKDFFIFSMTGSEDMAEKSLTPQIEAMKQQPAFVMEDDFRKGNLYYSVLEGGKHESSTFAPLYLYTALPEFFSRK